MAGEKDLAAFTIMVDPEGEDPFPIDVSHDVISFTYTDEEKRADKFELVLDNYDQKYSDDATFKKGNFLVVSWGYPGNMTPGYVCKIESFRITPNEMRVEAVHKLGLLDREKRSRSFENMTRSQVVRKIAEESGFGVRRQDIEDTKIKHPVISQAGVSDAAFLAQMAERMKFEFYVDESFHFHDRRRGQKPVKVLRYFIDEVGELLDYEIESDSKGKKGRVKHKGRDPITKKPFETDAKNKTVKRDALAPVIEVVDEETGQTTLQTRMVQEELAPSPAADAASAKRIAEGEYNNSQLSNFILRATIVGDPAVRAKRIVEVQGIGKLYSGKWYIKQVTHEIAAGTYTSKIVCGRDGHNGYPRSKDAKTAGNLNKEGVSNKPEQKEIVNERTGETRFVWEQKS